MSGAVREPPRAFEAELRRRWPDFRRIEWDVQFSRWRFFFTSAAGREASWLYMWDRDPRTGGPAEIDPVTGLRPFRELDAQAQAEIIYHGERTSLTNPLTGAGTWENATRRQLDDRARDHAKSRREQAENYAYALQQVDLRRPWWKHHQPQKKGTGPRVGYSPSYAGAMAKTAAGVTVLAPFGKGRKSTATGATA